MRLDPIVWVSIGSLAALYSGAAQADRGAAVLTGTVTNTADGRPIEGVVVVVASHSLQGEATATTDASGHFRLPNLPPGTYRLEVLGNGYTRYERTEIALRADATIRINPSLTPEGQDSRTITVAAPTVDIGSSSVGVSLDSEFTKRVPVVSPGGRGSAQRSFEAIAQVTPGASADTYGTSISGTTSPENKYLIDGVSVGTAGFGTNGFGLSSSFVSDVNVISGGYLPEYGRAGGGIISATTKSGSNEFHGSVWVNYSPGALEGKRKRVENQGSTLIAETELGMQGDVGADIGGPLIKDKLWFYVGVDAARTRFNTTSAWYKILTDDDGHAIVDDQGTEDAADDVVQREKISGTEEDLVATSTEYQAVAKLTFRASDHHSFNLSGMFAPTRSGGPNRFGINPATGFPDTNINGEFEARAVTRHGYAAMGNLVWNAQSKNKNWNFDTRLGWNRLKSTQLPIDGSQPGASSGLASIPFTSWRSPRSLNEIYDMPAGADPSACDPVDNSGGAQTIVCPMPVGFGLGGPPTIFERLGDSYSINHTVTRVLNGWGHHVLKAGVDAEYMNYVTSRGFSGGAIFVELEPGLWQTLRRYGYLTEADEPVEIRSFDRNPKSITAGVFVQDSWTIADSFTINVGGRYDIQNVYRADGNLFVSLPNQISPRVGFVYDFTREGRSKIFANYSKFYQSIPLQIVDRGGSGEPGLVGRYECENPTDDVDECYDNPVVVIPNGPSPHMGIYGAGSLAIDPNLKAPSSSEIVAGAEYEVFERARLGAQYTRRWLDRMIEDMSRDEGQTFFLGNPGEGIARDFPKARRNYDAINVYLQRRFHKGWQVMASYTLAWLRGNLDGLYRPSTGQLDPFAGSDFDLVSLLANRTGPLGADNRHEIKVFPAGEIPLPGNAFVALGGALTARSGGPTNYLGAHNPYGVGEAFLLPRGSGPRLPWNFSIDSNLGLGMAFTDDVRATLSVSVYNVANFQAVIARDENYTFDYVGPLPEGSSPADLADLTTMDGDGETIPATPNPNFGHPVAYQQPRRFTFGLRFEF